MKEKKFFFRLLNDSTSFFGYYRLDMYLDITGRLAENPFQKFSDLTTRSTRSDTTRNALESTCLRFFGVAPSIVEMSLTVSVTMFVKTCLRHQLKKKTYMY
jgi:hypothetical protein